MNKPKCKIGDLCLIIKGQQNVGKQCTVTGVGSGEAMKYNVSADWTIESPTPITIKSGETKHKAYAPDSYLLPINPGDLNELTEFESDKVKDKSRES